MDFPKLTVAALALASLAAACTDETGDDGQGHALEAQQQALERARDVEDDVREAAERQAEQIEQAEGGG